LCHHETGTGFLRGVKKLRKDMKKLIRNMTVAAALVFGFASCDTKKADDSKEVAEEQNDDNIEDKDVKKDSDFAVEVMDGGLLEVQASNLALTKGTSPEVKKYAQMMVDDHTKASNELKSVAASKNITLPDVMSEKCQKKFYDLDQKEKGEDFDKEYIDLMVKDHKDMIDKFEDQAEDGNDAELKTWASGKLEVLRHHLNEAQRIQDALKK
jgi:putative membrane protein